MGTAFYTNPRSAIHSLPDHPEHAGRLQGVIDRLTEMNLLEKMTSLAGQPVEDEDILRCHVQNYVRLLEKTAASSSRTMIDPDTYLVPETYEIAKSAAGGVMAVARAVAEGQATNGLVAIRPPGHHATPQRGMGFCLLNNIAIGARYVQAHTDLKRIAIVDFDVHHGNGTQDIFYEDPSVLFISSHQMPLYPATGAFKEMGWGEGEGYILNVPLSPGMGDDATLELYQEIVMPALEIYQPDMIMVSAGYDAHWRDPLAQIQLTCTGQAKLAQMLFDAAQALCGGKIVIVMEGGYDLEVLALGMENAAHVLLQDGIVSDPIGPATLQKPLPDGLIEKMKATHPLFNGF